MSSAVQHSDTSSWPTMPAEFRQASWADLPATIQPLPSGTAVLSVNGVDRPFPSVFAALKETDAQGIPRDRVHVLRFDSTPLAEPAQP
jgi:hypothetical protein